VDAFCFFDFLDFTFGALRAAGARAFALNRGRKLRGPRKGRRTLYPGTIGLGGRDFIRDTIRFYFIWIAGPTYAELCLNGANMEQSLSL